MLTHSEFEQYYNHNLISKCEHKTSLKTLSPLFKGLRSLRNEFSISGSEFYLF